LVAAIWETDDKVLKNSFVASVYRERFDSASQLCTIADSIWESAQLHLEEKLHGEMCRGNQMILIIWSDLSRLILQTM
jgi:hypothetical protein